MILPVYVQMAPRRSKEWFSLLAPKVSVHQEGVLNSASMFTAELCGILEAIDCSANVAEGKILLAAGSGISMKAIRNFCSGGSIVQKDTEGNRK